MRREEFGLKAPAPSPAPEQSASRRILAVDDDQMALFMVESQIGDLGYEVATATNGREALKALEDQRFDLVLLDRMMPEMDGLAVIRRMKAAPALAEIPVIMVTGADDTEEMREGIEAGVFYYLVKPAKPALLASVISAAFRKRDETERLKAGGSDLGGFRLMDAARFSFRRLSEAEALSGFIANFFDEPERVLPGVGALLINAVEHGICRVGFDRKGQLLLDGAWREEVDRLAEAWDGNPAHVSVARKDGGVAISVADPGPGFNWRDYVDFDATRSSRSHGRGIAQARVTSFDKIAFNKIGNEVVAFAKKNEELNW